MRNLIYLLSLLFMVLNISANEIPALDSCELVTEEAGQKYYSCKFLDGAKEISMLDLSGDIYENSYYHGKFLAKKIIKGGLAGITEQREMAMRNLSDGEREIFSDISSCIVNRYKRAVSKDFIRMTTNMHRGMVDAGVTEVSLKDFIEANLLVELSIFVDGLQYKLETNLPAAGAELASLCSIPLVKIGIFTAIKKMASFLKMIKFGCTGMAAPGNYTKDNNLILSRNFDTGLIGYFEKFPVIIKQTPVKGNAHVGMASAGIHYVGGISGFNDKGIAVSLHELQTRKYYVPNIINHPHEILLGRKKSDAMPFLLNRIVHEASSIDEAVKIIKKNRNLGAWIIFIGDDKTDEIASIEIAGKKVSVARRYRNKPMAQSNHFLSPKIEKYGFQYSYNKTLESKSRFNYVTEELLSSKGEIDHQWMIDHLAGHTDYFVGRRSFGRTVTKVYSSMSHIMIPGKRELWFSLSNTYPTTSSTFSGIKVDFNSGDAPFFIFIGDTTPNQDDVDRYPNWYASMKYYVFAYMNNKEEKNAANIQKSINLLAKGINLAEKDGITELPYYYMTARLKLYSAFYEKDNSKKLNLINSSIQILDFLLKEESKEKIKLHDFQKSLINLWTARALDLKAKLTKEESKSRAFYEAAFQTQIRELNSFGKHHFLDKLIKSYYKKGKYLTYGFENITEDVLEFPTVE